MKIEENKVVTMHYAVSDSEGTLIDSSYDHQPLTHIQGSGYLIPGLEDALIGKSAGDKLEEVTVPAEKAYGERHDGYVQTVPKELFQGIDDIEVGTQLRAQTDEGEQTVIVIDVTEDEITVDGNHPLAGIDLSFDVEILEVRDATEEEIASGQAKQTSSCCDTSDEESGGCCG